MLNNDTINISGYSPNQILAQEKRGSDSFISNGQMPIKPSDRSDEVEIITYRETLILLGFTLGKPIDDLFMAVQFPEGWQKDAYSEDPRHITIKDNQGRDRISIFYKAAFYDRCANASFIRRYTTDSIYYDSNGKITKNYNEKAATKIGVIDRGDNNAILFYSTLTLQESDRKNRDFYRKQDELMRQETSNWLDKQFPEWENPVAYW